MTTVFLWENPCHALTMGSRNTLFPIEASIVWEETLGLPSLQVVKQWVPELSQLQTITSVSWKWGDNITGKRMDKSNSAASRRVWERKKEARRWPRGKRNGWPRVSGGRNESIPGKVCSYLGLDSGMMKGVSILSFKWVLTGFRHFTHLF